MLNLMQEMYGEYDCQVIQERNLTKSSKLHIGLRQNYTDEDWDLYV
jgi:hypothetical protein